ncbi:hypothetical protein HPP92_012246 [Vanilla planifolia]|uniref:Uncharacterized protein n=1 Tax=Vanilla planifolia TaxID=51239 RepID=A0A835V1J5_VANPL|nr:hypothetical protein HPP92_012246 [Vanilla planifolia]
MKEVFRGLVFEYDTAGLMKRPDDHRLISFIAGQGYGVIQKFSEVLSILKMLPNKVGIEGAAELINDPNKGLKEVNEELQTYSPHITGVPHFLV